ncbi:hypothetical protein ACFVRR_17640 [Gottfriedia sp. NPDC057948]|uniref:hypothetical protein n=1 Tax=Gottfriedia sp. NPDC057948 TaxID=3346287 RepID=UPI0036DF1B8A
MEAIDKAGTTLSIKVGSKTIGTGKADSKGSFSIKVKSQKKTFLSTTTYSGASFYQLKELLT